MTPRAYGYDEDFALGRAGEPTASAATLAVRVLARTWSAAAIPLSIVRANSSRSRMRPYRRVTAPPGHPASTSPRPIHTNTNGALSMRTLTTTTTAVAVLALITACAPTDSADPNIAAEPSASGKAAAKLKAAKPKTTRTVTYKISGTADKAMVTYSTPSGTEQQNGAHVPWHKTFKVKKNTFDVLTVSAQNSGGGTITCEIDVDGVKVKAAKSSGAYAIASCDHALGF